MINKRDASEELNRLIKLNYMNRQKLIINKLINTLRGNR